MIVVNGVLGNDRYHAQVRRSSVPARSQTDGQPPPAKPFIVRLADRNAHVVRQFLTDSLVLGLLGGILGLLIATAFVRAFLAFAPTELPRLAAIGLYAITATAVRQQTHELGVRIALGATSGRIRRLVLGQVFWVVGIGAAVGLVAAVGASGLLRSMLFGISPTDPLTLTGVCLLLLIVSLVAAYLPSRRAALIDPVEALRAE